MKDLQTIAEILHQQIAERSNQNVVIDIAIRELPIVSVNETFADIAADKINSSLGNYIVKQKQISDNITVRLESVYHD